jgi:hypothetical protein
MKNKPILSTCEFWNSSRNMCRIDLKQCQCTMEDIECNKIITIQKHSVDQFKMQKGEK